MLFPISLASSFRLKTLLPALRAAVVAVGSTASAQETPAPAFSDTGRAAATQPWQVADLKWRNIGPANMMGRIAAIDAVATDPRHVVIASASGGVFQSHNGGVTWTPIFDRYGSGSIGAVALFQPDPKILWVGTGEAANRNSSGWGDGVYKSVDGGKTFRNVGLRTTHQIAEIAVHPTDPDIVFVAAIGHLWGPSGERGLFRTVDGGKTWTKLGEGLPADPALGATDVELDPKNPATVYAGMYHRERKPWSFRSGSRTGGLFKSTDGGDTWKKLTVGLPTGATGQIDISIHVADPKILVAAVETDENLPADQPGSGVYRSDDGGASWRFLLKHCVRPFYHGQIAIDPMDPQRIYVVSREFRVSKDGGKTFGPRWWGGGGDDHDMWICPTDNRIWYNATDQGAQKTVDGGRTITFLNNMAIGQYYAIGVDMRDPYWVVGGLQDNGLWMGPSNSREPRGILNRHNTWIAEGDGFHSQVDPTDWRTVYVVNHVGFAARLNAETREHAFITPTPETIVNYEDFVDRNDAQPRIRYTISPGEQWFFGYDPGRPVLPPQFRFNWSSPLVLAPTNPRTVYFGSNHLFGSTDRGRTWRILSPDLTTDDRTKTDPSNQGGLTRSCTGGENFCTIVTIGPSPVDPAVIWVGTDDGNLQVTRDLGASWKNVVAAVPGVPKGTWVSRVEPSRVAPGRCYVTFDNHRRDDTRPFVFVTEDFGATWQDLSTGLPDGSVYVIREHPRAANLLFIGTEFAVHASVDRGASWTRLHRGMPTVATHDLVIHPRDGDLIAGTHGRSVWILDDLSPLEEWSNALAAAKGALLFPPRRATQWLPVRLGRMQPNRMFRGENPPGGALLHVYLPTRSKVRLAIQDIIGTEVASVEADCAPGIRRLRWDLRIAPDEAARREAHARLRSAVRQVATRIPEGQADHRATLAKLQRDLGRSAPPSVRALRRARRTLVRELGRYAAGRPVFPPPLRSRPAPAGSYRVVLFVDGREQGSRRLDVRDDPLKTGGSSGR